MPGLLLQIDQIDTFNDVRDFPAKEVSNELQAAVRSLDEREELEPFIRAILMDASDTPHGPAEIADIITHKIVVEGKPQLAAFILKGKSFPTVRPSHVSHQIYRLEKIQGLEFAGFIASGTILDAAKEQFTATCERLGVQYTLSDAIDISRLLVAYGFLCPKDAGRIVGGRCKCGYSPNRKVLNFLQRESLKELASAHEIGQRSGLVVLPTGSGKTRIAAKDAEKLGAQRILYVAHTHEILDVAESEFLSIFGSDNVTRHTSESIFGIINKVNLTTIQSLQSKIDNLNGDSFDYVVIDEFHHAAAPSYRKLIERLYPGFLLGLTATPFRGDRQDITLLCDGNILVEFELRTGIESGILSPYHYFGCFDDVDYSILRQHSGKYTVRDLEKTLIIPERDNAIVQKWRELAENKPTLAFCCSHKHARRVAKRFQDQGILSEVYLFDTEICKRQKLVNELKRGEIKVLCTVDVLNEGADIPFIECLLFLRPTESKRIFFQQLGRGLRKSVGKSHCVVIDFIGAFRNAYRVVEYHGLIPESEDEPASSVRITRNIKEILNLPIGCEVHFDDKVIDLFTENSLDPRRATRKNIGRILIYQYEKLERSLGHRSTKKEVDMYAVLSSHFYTMVFGSWSKFQQLIN